MAHRKDADLLQHIEALHKTNTEIISRIKAKKKIVLSYSYTIELTTQFNVLEIREEEDAAELLKIWKPDLKLRVIADLFKDNLIYKCATFEDLVHLNSGMHTTALKYKIFGGSEEAEGILGHFVENFESVHGCLVNLEEKLTDAKRNLVDLQRGVHQLNDMVSSVLNEAQQSHATNSYWKKIKEEQLKIKHEGEKKKIKWWKDRCSSAITLDGKYATFTGTHWCALLCKQKNPSHVQIKVHQMGHLEIGLKTLSGFRLNENCSPDHFSNSFSSFSIVDVRYDGSKIVTKVDGKKVNEVATCYTEPVFLCVNGCNNSKIELINSK